jgi:hypothetical protein
LNRENLINGWEESYFPRVLNAGELVWSPWVFSAQWALLEVRLANHT